MKKNSEKVFGIEVFACDEQEDFDVNMIKFYNVEFLFKSMKQFNGRTVIKRSDSYLVIYNDDADVLWEGFAEDIPEFKEQLAQNIIKDFITS